MITEIKFLMMVGKKIRKRDVVLLLDGRVGKVLEQVADSPESIFKIMIVDTGHIDYYGESKLSIKKQHFLNQLKTLLRF